MNFIELTGATSGERIIVAAEHISCIYPATELLHRMNEGVIGAGAKAVLSLPFGTIEVRQTCDQIFATLDSIAGVRRVR